MKIHLSKETLRLLFKIDFLTYELSVLADKPWETINLDKPYPFDDNLLADKDASIKEETVFLFISLSKDLRNQFSRYHVHGK